ncbi:regulatory protein [uncultured Gammaproteobacteria bacterium]
MSKVRSLRRRGASTRAIRDRLSARGLSADHISAALTGEEDERDDHDDLPDPDLAAALAYAKRRRLGQFRVPADRATHRLKDLAALGRTGFSGAIARQVVDGESEFEDDLP